MFLVSAQQIENGKPRGFIYVSHVDSKTRAAWTTDMGKARQFNSEGYAELVAYRANAKRPDTRSVALVWPVGTKYRAKG